MKYNARKPYSPARHRSVLRIKVSQSCLFKRPSRSPSKSLSPPFKPIPKLLEIRNDSDLLPSLSMNPQPSKTQKPRHRASLNPLQTEAKCSPDSFLTDSFNLLESVLSKTRGEKQHLLSIEILPVIQSPNKEQAFKAVKFNKRIDLELLLYKSPSLVSAIDSVRLS